MDLQERLKRSLLHTRGFTDAVLGEIVSDDDWIRRPVPHSNHALWIAGHLGYATNAFIGFIDASQKQSPENYPTLFGKGSELVDDLAAYPKPAEVTKYLSERSEVFLSMLDQCSEEDFLREVSEGPAFMDDVGAVFQGAIWHEALHAGQLSVIHRMIGQSPLSDR